jgi:hypothetical protein
MKIKFLFAFCIFCFHLNSQNSVSLDVATGYHIFDKIFKSKTVNDYSLTSIKTNANLAYSYNKNKVRYEVGIGYSLLSYLAKSPPNQISFKANNTNYFTFLYGIAYHRNENLDFTLRYLNYFLLHKYLQQPAYQNRHFSNFDIGINKKLNTRYKMLCNVSVPVVTAFNGLEGRIGSFTTKKIRGENFGLNIGVIYIFKAIEL